MKVKVRVWVEDDEGNPILGDGRLALLKAIEQSGSLRSATEEMGMSYRHAWGQVKKIERTMGVKIMERQVGGKEGGGSCLTKETKEFIRKFEKIKEDVARYAATKSSKF